METNFISRFHPEMNPFWAQMKRALKTLPNDHKSSCGGVYVCDSDFLSDILSTKEKEESFEKFLGALCLWLNFPSWPRSDEWKQQDILEMFPTIAISLETRCAGFYEHDSMAYEAIAFLFLVAFSQRDSIPFDHPNFWNVFYLKVFNFSKKNIPDNKWIRVIALAMSTL